MNKPRGLGEPLDVSICVVTYNHEKFIAQCLQSLVDQRTSVRFEILVGEDASTDATREIVQAFASAHPGLVRPLLHPANIGMIPNLLAVHGAARGELVCHCDGDDYWEPEKLEQQVRFLEHHPECSAVFTNSHVVAEDGERMGVFSRGVPPSFGLDYLIRDGNFLHHSSMMYRRLLQDRIFPPAPEFIDFQIYVRLARCGRLGYIDSRLTSYRARSAASVIHNDSMRIWRLYWQALREVTFTDASREAIRRADASFLADAAWHVLRHRDATRFIEGSRWVEQRWGAGLRSTQLLALLVLATSTLRRVVFYMKANLGLQPPASRVFYAK